MKRELEDLLEGAQRTVAFLLSDEETFEVGLAALVQLSTVAKNLASIPNPPEKPDPEFEETSTGELVEIAKGKSST